MNCQQSNQALYFVVKSTLYFKLGVVFTTLYLHLNISILKPGSNSTSLHRFPTLVYFETYDTITSTLNCHLNYFCEKLFGIKTVF